jgi:hypothetical protein
MEHFSRLTVFAAHAVCQIAALLAVLIFLGLPIAALSQCSYTALVDGEIYDILGAQQDDEYFYQVVQPSSTWCAVAVRTEWRAVDPNLSLYPEWTGVPPCVGGDLVCECNLPSSQVDFIVLDYTQLAPGTEYYAMVSIDDGPGDCHVQWEGGAQELSVGGNTFWHGFGPTSFLVKVLSVYLTEGMTYRFTFDCLGTDVRMCLFYGGAGAWGSRADAEFEVACGQPYQEYTAPASQMYALVMFNEGGTGGEYEVGPIVITPVERKSWGVVKALYR